MRSLLLTMFLVLAACAKPGSEQASVTSPAPHGPSAPVATKVVRCGDTIVYAGGFAFRVDVNTKEVFSISDGIYGWDKHCNAWSCWEACHYEIKDGALVN